MKKTLIIFAVLAVMPPLVYAHHGTNGQFDSSKIIEVKGVISDVAFVNPHAYVYLDVAGEDGQTETWNCELRAASVMKRSGWTKEMFANGINVDIVGVAARRDPLGCYVETISFNGGTPIERYAQIEENQLQMSAERAKDTSWGTPNIAGDWAAEQRLFGAISGPNATAGMGMGAGMARPGGGGVQMTDAGTAALASLSTEEDDNITGRLDCSPRDFFNDWTFDQHPNRIIQEQDKVVLMYGFMDTVRTIHMNMSEHPDNIKASWAGHSIGKWQDNVLVVDTIGFTEAAYRGNAHSTDYRTVERFSVSADGELIRDYEAFDPQYWQEGQLLSGQQILSLSDYPYEPYKCDDRSVE